MTGAGGSVLAIEDLVVSFASDEGEYDVLDRVSITLRRNQILGVVGESGCGKSVTALSILRLLPQPAGKIVSGKIIFNEVDLLQQPSKEMHKIRGRHISMIFQEPMTALNPVQRIGRQLSEVYKLHFPDMMDERITAAAIEMLGKVGIPAPDKRMHEYPHQLSGGMRQRVMIAMALAPQPDILIADEPTTALDVTIQGQILELLKALQKETGMSIIFITHDLGVVANLCDEVIVMYAGRVVEKALTEDLFKSPSHPYTKGLLNSIPRLNGIAKSRLNVIEGIVPGPGHFPEGCRFQDRCEYMQPDCKGHAPPLEAVSTRHQVACLHRQS